MIWRCGSFSFDSRMPVVMGILNVTPDSFSDGGSYANAEEAIAAGLSMKEAGALIIDVGGESTRPGSTPVSPQEELDRVLPVVRGLVQQGVCVSVDTRHASVARACVEAGAAIINDISGFSSSDMVRVAQECEAGLIVMHMQGEPSTMQQFTQYDDVVAEVRDYLEQRCRMLEEEGVARDRIAIDPGPGFSKTPKQTIELMRNLHEFVRTGYPVVAAPSRKSYIGYAYGIEDPRDRDEASVEEALMACELGASVVRMHNVPLTVEKLAAIRPYVLLGLGCNVALVGERGQEQEAKIAQLNQAISSICMMPDTQMIDCSSFYASEPAYLEDQDAFVNAVVLLRTGLAPRDLLQYLHAVEDSLGRVRTVKNGPRTCDIDILDYQLYVSDDEQLTLPHPLLTERDFVVKPLLELLPRHILSDGTLVTLDTVTVGAAQKIR
ncbi:dihydropteroate synthase [Denitrobacterium detoxificans]|uniref:dihydropteroate synthase n=1 Tax=Denitrobacterium detoxificans TaxID=79604 RepID=UPI0026F12434|nr:dihydropteroate synthase [Denitrobacterium detoxificans]MBE6466295.1 dihydropteroate synthase [Denitrobacterium detoxificans]